jgi:DNA-binding transcriptional LysR family regulator
LDGLNTALLTGVVDIAFAQQISPQPGLRIDRLGAIPCAVYAGRGHPLHGIKRPSLAHVLGHPFVAVSSGARTGGDLWPAELERSVSLYVDDLELAVAACASGKYLALLPEIAIHADPGRRRLWRIGVPVIRSGVVYAVLREPLTPSERAQVVLEAVREQMARRQST